MVACNTVEPVQCHAPYNPCIVIPVYKSMCISKKATFSSTVAVILIMAKVDTVALVAV